MAILTELLKKAKEWDEEGPHADTERPIQSEFLEWLISMQDLLLKAIGKKPTDPLPHGVFEFLIIMWAASAKNALHCLHQGLAVRDGDGMPVDKRYYSLQELISEAQCMMNPEEEAEILEEVLLDLPYEEDDGDEDDDEEITDVISTLDEEEHSGPICGDCGACAKHCTCDDEEEQTVPRILH